MLYFLDLNLIYKINNVQLKVGSITWSNANDYVDINYLIKMILETELTYVLGYNMKYETKGKNAMGSNRKRVLKKNRFNSSLDNRYNILRAIDNEEDSFLKGSSSKLTTRVKQKLNI